MKRNQEERSSTTAELSNLEGPNSSRATKGIHWDEGMYTGNIHLMFSSTWELQTLWRDKSVFLSCSKS